jgi:hypothetical protein
MKVKQTIKKPANPHRVPFDREVAKSLGEFFGRSIINVIPEENGKALTYSIPQSEQVQLDYEFDKNVISRIKNELQIEAEDTQLNVGRQAGKMWMSLIVLAYEQRQGKYEVEGTFRYADIERLWGARKSGQLYTDIRNLFLSLSSVKFTQKTKMGDETEVEFYSLINYGKIAEKKDNDEATVFSFTLNNKALGLTADWIRFGKLSLARQKEGYLSVPVTDLKDSAKDTDYLNFRERLRLFGGGRVNCETVMRAWLKITSADRLKRREHCRQAISKCLEKAKKAGELSDYQFDAPITKQWRQLWQVTIIK